MPEREDEKGEIEFGHLEIPPPPIQDKAYLTHRRWMMRALELAEFAGKSGEVPVGAVVVGPDNTLLAEAANRRESDHDPAAHAEILALRAAGRILNRWRLHDCTLYVTLEPCPMCAGAIIQARLGLLVYGADDPKTGAIRSVLNLPDGAASNHRLPVLGGILESVCRQQLQAWFRRYRR
ncbi:MAG: tRNA adenosine(34) deaminase TadA [Leptolyngbyaceae cyanobacterium MO_188.B28]|nr:tRNA adenosine(34) deaminase TadA [Leptolyngbyaceae cyanobacterium MO_188.B28]